MTREIPLTRGAVAIVDDEDYDRVMAAARPRWRYLTGHRGKGYAATGKHPDTLLLHRLILNLPSGRSPQVDHINGDGLDNRHVNLRPATPGQNQANSRPRGGTSRFKGVFWVTRDKVWRACIGAHRDYIGSFHDEEEAARAYDAAARARWGDYAQVNFP